jgi:hypothetical protein
LAWYEARLTTPPARRDQFGDHARARRPPDRRRRRSRSLARNLKVRFYVDHRTSVLLPDQTGRLSVPTSAGVGVVYPIETIREALNVEDLAAARREADV